MPVSNRMVVDRRRFLRLGVAGVGAVAAGTSVLSACSSSGSANTASGSGGQQLDFINPSDREIAATEALRKTSGNEVKRGLTAKPVTVDLGGRRVQTWTMGDEAVAPELRVSAGDVAHVTVANQITEPTTVHWHGVRIRNDMDGVSPVTQAAIDPNANFDYKFVAQDPGTYWYHSHSGLQADRGMFGALVVEDPGDTTGADADVTVVLDDWLDGMGVTPNAILTALNSDLAGMEGMAGMSGMSMAPAPSPNPQMSGLAKTMVAQGHGNSDVLGGMTQHIAYPLHVINGKPPNDPSPIEVAAGQRVRLRIVNAGAETPYRFAVAGHRMSIIAVDGYDVVPTEADSILLGMAQRYDVVVTAKSGVWPIVSKVEGRPGYGATVLRTHDAVAAATSTVVGDIPELHGELVTEDKLRPADSVKLPTKSPDREYDVDLIQAGDRYAWAMTGSDVGKMVMKSGERVRITMHNKSPMWHPMHTHGHTFAIPDYGGLRRDTVIVLPGKSLAFEFDADNPGKWMFHCHNAYHFEAGMTSNLMYIR